MVHVPYRGTAPAMADILAGRVAMMIDGVPVQTPNIRSGKVRALGVTTGTRSPALIAQLSVALRTAMRDPLVVKQLADVGTEAVGSTSDELDALTRQQFALYRGIVQENRSLLGEP